MIFRLSVSVVIAASLLYAQHDEEWDIFIKRMGQEQASNGRFGWPAIDGHFSLAERRVIVESIVRAMGSPDNYDNPEFRQYVQSQAHFNLVKLSTDGATQILVIGPESMCGVTGNCAMWLYARIHGRLRLVLQTGGAAFFIQREANLGFHDFATYFRGSASTGDFVIYRWNGSAYQPFRCMNSADGVVSSVGCKSDK